MELNKFVKTKQKTTFFMNNRPVPIMNNRPVPIMNNVLVPIMNNGPVPNKFSFIL